MHESRVRVTSVMGESTNVHVVDLETREMRASYKDDVAMNGVGVGGAAEVTSGMLLGQPAHSGAPAFHSIIPSHMDPQVGGYIDEVPSPVGMMASQLARAWNVPSLGGGSVSGDAPDVGWQWGMEAGLRAACISLSGAELCGFAFDEAALALEVIAAAGPRGHFLRQKHTRRRMRDHRLSRLPRQRDAAGNPHVPREEFRRTLRTHQPAPLLPEVSAELDRILAAADREAEGRNG